MTSLKAEQFGLTALESHPLLRLFLAPQTAEGLDIPKFLTAREFSKAIFPLSIKRKHNKKCWRTSQPWDCGDCGRLAAASVSSLLVQSC